MRCADSTFVPGSVGRRRRGAAIIYGVVLFSVAVALCSLAVDYGRAQLARMELQGCADGAARAAAAGIPISLDEARSRARAVATLNKAAGAAIALDDADFRFGRWNDSTHAIEPATGSAIDAVEVTPRRTVSLVFGAVLGRETVNVAARATGRAPKPGVRGFIGLNDVELKNTAFMGSYASSKSTSATPALSTGRGTIASNGNITFKNNTTIDGDVVMGPAGQVVYEMGFAVNGSTVRESAPLAATASPAWAPVVNPLGLPLDYTVSSITTLPGGTYWFTSLTINRTLTFSGPATVYVNGNIDVDAALNTFGSLPANLAIYQLGSNRTFDARNNLELYAEVHAPGSTLVGHNKLSLYGSGVYEAISVKNHAEFFFDLSAPSAGREIMLVK